MDKTPLHCLSDTELPGLTWTSASAALYVGKADDGLRRRIGREHDGDAGRATLKRSLAGLLKDQPGLVARYRPTRGKPKLTNFDNFSLEFDGDGWLSEWMAAHLVVVGDETVITREDALSVEPARAI